MYVFRASLVTAGLIGVACATVFAGPAPQAQAEPFPAGVTCADTTCRNDTDGHYLIEAWQRCRTVGSQSVFEVPFNVVVAPHESRQVEGTKCPDVEDDRTVLGKDPFPPRWLKTEPVGIGYFKAVPYDPNAPKARSGSAG